MKAGLAVNIAFATWRSVADIIIDSFEWLRSYASKEWTECLKKEVAQLSTGWYTRSKVHCISLINSRVAAYENVCSNIVS